MDKIEGIQIDYDPATQDVALRFDPEKFKNWDFVIAIMDMAKEKAKAQRQHQMVMQMQANQQRAMRDAAIAQQVAGKRLHL